MKPSLHLRGALVWDGEQFTRRDLFIQSGRFISQPVNAQVVDLDGLLVLPGLVNAHDHLELNHYPRTRYRDRYDNAHQWGEDVNVRLPSEPFRSLRAYPLRDRLFIGGLKNLLSGATTIIQHGTAYRELFGHDYPVRVLRRYGWAHSLHFSSAAEIKQSYHSTPRDIPWFIHLAEGTDSIAAAEYQQLKKLGCLQSNTVLIHAVGLSPDEVLDDAGRGQRVRAVVTCPTTNTYLLGKTLHPALFQQAGIPILPGSDSRLTALGDLLDEISAWNQITASEFWQTLPAVGQNTARILGIPHTSRLQPGAQADLLIVPADLSATQQHLRRSQIAAVLIDGVWKIGDSAIANRFHANSIPCQLDGIEKRIQNRLAQQIQHCTLKEQGLMIDAAHKRTRWFFWH